VRGEIPWITDTLVGRISNAGPSASALLFLLRRYTTDGGDNVRHAVEVGLTEAIPAFNRALDPRDRMSWLLAFAEAAAVSDDERLAETVQQQVGPALDDMERLVGASYEPGEGILGASAADQLQSARAFLGAFELTGRLPYSMLAEELFQTSRRVEWSEEAGAFGAEFLPNCLAVQVSCRLAILHRDPDYRTSAVIADRVSYERDAERMLTWLVPRSREHDAFLDEYGLALLEWFALSAHPN
jgi:hypothetical protein